MFNLLFLITILAIGASFSRNKVGKIFLWITLCISFSITSYHNLALHPHYQVWMCNFTALFALIILLQFKQILFDIFFFFSWVGDVFTFIVPNNQTLPDIHEFPITWMAYWLKHIIPLCITIYLIFSEKRRLSKNAIWVAFTSMIVYVCFMGGYNVIFNQNIMDLRYPTVEIEHYFGPWPIYIFIDMIIVLIWYLLIDIIQKKITSFLDS